MRTLCGVIATIMVLACLAAPAEAGRSGAANQTPFFASSVKRMIGSGHHFSSNGSHGLRTVFRHRRTTFFNPGPVPPFTGTIVPPFEIGSPINRRDRFSRKGRRFDSIFITGFIDEPRREPIIILERIVVPVAVPLAATPPVKAQIVELQPSPEAGTVQIFSPSTGP